MLALAASRASSANAASDTVGAPAGAPRCCAGGGAIGDARGLLRDGLSLIRDGCMLLRQQLAHLHQLIVDGAFDPPIILLR